jgi:type I restriction enzyme R subunit
MRTTTPEGTAREKIDAKLIASGWIIQDYKSIDFSLGRGIAVREVPLKDRPMRLSSPRGSQTPRRG